MIDLTKSQVASPSIHIVPSDPGRSWVKDAEVAVDAPPDSEVNPLPEARWPARAQRTGIFGAVSPRVILLAGGGYRLYYTQISPRPGFPAGANDYDNATTRILSATSVDGSVWAPEPGVRLSPQQGGAGEFRVVSCEVVPLFGASGQLRMYYECCTGPISVPNAIRSALSQDGGLTWTPEPGARLQSAGRNYASPRIVILNDRQCRLYCYERGLGIISALSEDGGLTFRQESGLRIAQGGAYDARVAFAPEIVRLEGMGYVMYYAGCSAPNRVYILRAVSQDGLTWRKEPEPVLSPSPGSLSAAKCSEMSVFPLPRQPGQSIRYRMVYEACDGTAKDERGVWRVAIATSVA